MTVAPVSSPFSPPLSPRMRPSCPSPAVSEALQSRPPEPVSTLLARFAASSPLLVFLKSWNIDEKSYTLATGTLDLRGKLVALSVEDKNRFLDGLCGFSPALEELSLAGNALQEIPPYLVYLTNLKKLDLSDNALSSTRAAFPSSLTSLSLAKNQLAEVYLPFASSLESLDLSSNQIASLPKELVQLERLQRLYLQYNQLASLPDELDLPSLTLLNLDNNPFFYFPRLKKLPKLRELSTRHNQFDFLNESLFEITSLQKLALDDNSIRAIPQAIGSLTNLQHLSLNGTWMQHLPEEIATLPHVKIDLFRCDCLEDNPAIDPEGRQPLGKALLVQRLESRVCFDEVHAFQQVERAAVSQPRSTRSVTDLLRQAQQLGQPPQPSGGPAGRNPLKPTSVNG